MSERELYQSDLSGDQWALIEPVIVPRSQQDPQSALSLQVRIGSLMAVIFEA